MLKNVKDAKEMIKTNSVSVVIGETGLGKLNIIQESLSEIGLQFDILSCAQIIDGEDLNLHLSIFKKDNVKAIILDRFNRLNGHDNQVVETLVKLIHSNEYKIIISASTLDNDFSGLLNTLTRKYPTQKLTLDTEFLTSMSKWDIKRK